MSGSGGDQVGLSSLSPDTDPTIWEVSYGEPSLGKQENFSTNQNEDFDVEDDDDMFGHLNNDDLVSDGGEDTKRKSVRTIYKNMDNNEEGFEDTLNENDYF
jgi:hypothetical protein